MANATDKAIGSELASNLGHVPESRTGRTIVEWFERGAREARVNASVPAVYGPFAVLGYYSGRAYGFDGIDGVHRYLTRGW